MRQDGTSHFNNYQLTAQQHQDSSHFHSEHNLSQQNQQYYATTLVQVPSVLSEVRPSILQSYLQRDRNNDQDNYTTVPNNMLTCNNGATSSYVAQMNPASQYTPRSSSDGASSFLGHSVSDNSINSSVPVQHTYNQQCGQSYPRHIQPNNPASCMLSTIMGQFLAPQQGPSVFDNHHNNSNPSNHDATISPNGNIKKRTRQTYDKNVTLELEMQYSLCKYITKRGRSMLAKQLNLSEKQIKTWFQNKRMKDKKQRKMINTSDDRNITLNNPALNVSTGTAPMYNAISTHEEYSQISNHLVSGSMEQLHTSVGQLHISMPTQQHLSVPTQQFQSQNDFSRQSHSNYPTDYQNEHYNSYYNTNFSGAMYK